MAGSPIPPVEFCVPPIPPNPPHQFPTRCHPPQLIRRPPGTPLPGELANWRIGASARPGRSGRRQFQPLLPSPLAAHAPDDAGVSLPPSDSSIRRAALPEAPRAIVRA
ncbi:hypothetical protein I7I50_00986 [Histoplasma capsulatum G186AR]|uniref:Uncharacterized protein n=1 Tax=Ajellomyces capsulatus TaxID=5037 RepID=A0A8H8CW80_AJECA|nr:hypothetical protein I7I52_08252 [Histoplasma capsulatum]QSS72976.1 hypothetical protein I7I50_00986 [Histoplasma capsulatum G186AR]